MKRILLYTTVMVVLVTACHTRHAENDLDQPGQKNNGASQYKNRYKIEESILDTTQSAAQEASAPPASRLNTHQDWDKKIIKTAEVTLELKDYAAYDKRLHNGLKAYGAYVAAEEQNTSAQSATNEVTIKVPVDQFENLMNSFSGDGITVLQKKILTEDVTGEVVDTRSRIEAKKQVRERYLQLLKQARNMKEILEVQAEVNSVQEDIESATGRVGYLTHQSAYSTIHLKYFQLLNGITPVQQTGFLVEVKESFYTGIRFIGHLVVMLVSIWPLVLAVTLVVLWIRRSKPLRSN